ncbi:MULTISPECIES: S66 peptidase family protein [Rheinheimera]|uniref:LD-carboxypeptidase n=3 Tax=Rheinheimera aquimaris TaxID=412437 RepID=A0ABN1DTX2_9GAMM|nr:MULTISPECIES: LD-carboxypeptidase [Rheinheimera]MCB5214113.1 LD-carboxypeptidase [Rheinheimera aquimaris]MCD1597676.1 LD-carboxypeptidase [Rheinheimera aquimaris]
MDKRQFIKNCALAASLIPLASCANVIAAPAANKGKRLLPVALNPGDTVALVSPSKATDNKIDLQIATEVMQALGLKVKTGQHLASRRGHLAGTDLERASDINAMFADKEVKAIICLRGGSGAARVLPLLDYNLIRNNPKILLGYSDITALHNAIHAQTGLVTFHGPNGTGSWNSFNADQFRRVFFDRELMHYQNVIDAKDELAPRQNRTITITGGKVQGELIGGNLTVLTALAGSPYLPDFSGKILFVEDVEEAPYRIDRMLSTLKLMGALDKIAGFIFGECTDCRPSGGYGWLTMDQIFDDHIKPLNIPAYRGAMIGHIKQQFIVPVGGRVELDADAGNFRLLDNVFQNA